MTHRKCIAKDMIIPRISAEWSTTKPIVPFSGTPSVQEVHTIDEVVHITLGKENINLSQRIGNDYFTFGVFLLNDKTGARIEVMETRNLKDPDRINSDIFTKWLQGSGAQPVTWRTLDVKTRNTAELFT